MNNYNFLFSLLDLKKKIKSNLGRFALCTNIVCIRININEHTRGARRATKSQHVGDLKKSSAHCKLNIWFLIWRVSFYSLTCKPARSVWERRDSSLTKHMPCSLDQMLFYTLARWLYFVTRRERMGRPTIFVIVCERERDKQKEKNHYLSLWEPTRELNFHNPFLSICSSSSVANSIRSAVRN